MCLNAPRRGSARMEKAARGCLSQDITSAAFPYLSQSPRDHLQNVLQVMNIVQDIQTSVQTPHALSACHPQHLRCQLGGRVEQLRALRGGACGVPMVGYESPRDVCWPPLQNRIGPIGDVYLMVGLLHAARTAEYRDRNQRSGLFHHLSQGSRSTFAL